MRFDIKTATVTAFEESLGHHVLRVARVALPGSAATWHWELRRMHGGFASRAGAGSANTPEEAFAAANALLGCARRGGE